MKMSFSGSLFGANLNMNLNVFLFIHFFNPKTFLFDILFATSLYLINDLT